jgi:CRP-like cAMP-binding protein
MAYEKRGRRSFPAGSTIFREGDGGDCAYLIESGEVVISKQTPEGFIELGRLGPHTIFGEMAILDGQPRMASATAIADTTLIPVDQVLFEAKLAAADPFLRALMLILMRNIRTTSGKLRVQS